MIYSKVETNVHISIYHIIANQSTDFYKKNIYEYEGKEPFLIKLLMKKSI